MPPLKPRVTIGIPVYNGENFLEQAIVSILGQTFTDFELIISDNASSDETEDISRSYETQDERIRYVRNAHNLGAAKNFNQLVNLAKGEYFKWAAHDDAYGPELLDRCVSVLDTDDSIILCYSLVQVIDERNNFLNNLPAKPYLTWAKLHKRFFETVCNYHDQTPVFGVMRTDILKKTMMLGSFPESDKVLLGELTLLGPSYEVPEYLYYKRIHPEQGWRLHKNQHERQLWYDPRQAEKRIFATWRLLQEHLKSIERVPLNRFERVICYLSMGWWVRRRWRRLLNDLFTDRIMESQRSFSIMGSKTEAT